MSYRQKTALVRQADVVFSVARKDSKSDEKRKPERAQKRCLLCSGDVAQFGVRFKRSRLPDSAFISVLGFVAPVAASADRHQFFCKELALPALSSEVTIEDPVAGMPISSHQSKDGCIAYVARLTCVFEGVEMHWDAQFEFSKRWAQRYSVPNLHSAGSTIIKTHNVVLAASGLLRFTLLRVPECCRKVSAAIKSQSGSRARVQELGTVCYRMRHPVACFFPLEQCGLECTVDFHEIQQHTYLLVRIDCGIGQEEVNQIELVII